MVIVYEDISVVSVFFSIVFSGLGSELRAYDGGSLVVNVEGEGVGIGGIALLGVPVEFRSHRYFVTGVVAAEYGVVLRIYHRKIEVEAVRSRRSAVMRLIAVVFLHSLYNPTRRGVGDGNRHLLCAS